MGTDGVLMNPNNISLYYPSMITNNTDSVKPVSYNDVWDMYSKLGFNDEEQRLIGEYTIKKEETMSISGNFCHLCGAKKKFESTETYKSKFNESGISIRFESYTYIDYECGTKVELCHKRKGPFEKDRDPKVVVGKNCIKVPAA